MALEPASLETPPPRRRTGELSAVGLATLLAAVLTAFHLGHESLWLDEAFSLGIVSQSWAGLWRFLAAQEANMSAYYVLLKPWVALVGDSEARLRALSALFAVATIPVQYRLARRLCGPRTATLAAVLLASHLFFVRYAQEARAYAMVCFFSALSSLLLLRALARPSLGRWLAYALCGALLVHCHILGALILLAHAASVVLFQPRTAWLGALGGFSSLTVLSLPLLSFFVRHRDSGIVSWVPKLSLHGFAVVLHDLSGKGGMSVIFIVGATLALRRLRRPAAATSRTQVQAQFQAQFQAQAQAQAPGAAYAALWFALPLCVLFFVSLLVRPLFQPAYLIGTLPAVTILVASGLAELTGRWRRGLVLLWLPAAAASLGSWYFLDQKVAWRAAVAEIVAHGQPGDGVLVLPPYLRPTVDYYLGRSGKGDSLVPVFPAIPWGHACEWEPFEAQVIHGTLDAEQLAGRGFRQLWVLSPREIHTPDPRFQPLVQTLTAHGYHTSTQTFYQVELTRLVHY